MPPRRPPPPRPPIAVVPCLSQRAAANDGGGSAHLLFECVDFRGIEEQEHQPVADKMTELCGGPARVAALSLFKDQQAVAVSLTEVSHGRPPARPLACLPACMR